ncbi:STAS domain-containing protein [Streptomyces sp. NPDC051740]|uniref:STAS domain-containing protein n=1 Tax=Streptomyces sp. NPDC051740 TaxID=3365673 RepID=UPI00378FF0CB
MVTATTADGVRVLTSAGEIDHDSGETLRRALDVSTTGRSRIVAGLRQVTFMDSGGINILLTAHRPLAHVLTPGLRTREKRTPYTSAVGRCGSAPKPSPSAVRADRSVTTPPPAPSPRSPDKQTGCADVTSSSPGAVTGHAVVVSASAPGGRYPAAAVLVSGCHGQDDPGRTRAVPRRCRRGGQATSRRAP